MVQFVSLLIAKCLLVCLLLTFDGQHKFVEMETQEISASCKHNRCTSLFSKAKNGCSLFFLVLGYVYWLGIFYKLEIKLTTIFILSELQKQKV